MITTKQAWHELGVAWKNPTHAERAEPRTTLLGMDTGFGLCHGINKMEAAGYITEEQAEHMLAVIDDINTYGGYVWPTTLEGARQRSDFAFDQEKMCRE